MNETNGNYPDKNMAHFVTQLEDLLWEEKTFASINPDVTATMSRVEDHQRTCLLAEPADKNNLYRYPYPIGVGATVIHFSARAKRFLAYPRRFDPMTEELIDADPFICLIRASEEKNKRRILNIRRTTIAYLLLRSHGTNTQIVDEISTEVA